jgi:hypothetical protein
MNSSHTSLNEGTELLGTNRMRTGAVFVESQPRPEPVVSGISFSPSKKFKISTRLPNVVCLGHSALAKRQKPNKLFQDPGSDELRQTVALNPIV